MTRASDWSWVMYIKVVPTLAWSFLSSTFICSRSFRSRAPRGSSSRSTDGSRTRQRAMATRCRCPPDSWSIRLPPKPGSPTRSRMASVRLRTSGPAVPRRFRPKATFSATSIMGNRARCWNTRFTGRLLGGTPSMSRPRISMEPGRGVLKPGDHAQKRGLAAAGRAENGKKGSVKGTSKVTSSTAVKSPKRFTRARTERSLVMRISLLKYGMRRISKTF